MAYKHNDHLHKHKVRARRLRIVATTVTAVVSLFVLAIGIDWIINQLNDSETVVSSETSKVVQSANVSVFRTEYFQFQAPESWVEVASETTNNRFVYVKNNGNLITNKFTVIVNRPETNREADFKLTRVLPVELDSGNNFIPLGSVSDHCKENFPDNQGRNPARITHANVSFVCAPDSVQYNVAIGQYDDDESIKVKMSDGREIDLFIVYSDLTAYPSSGDIFNIVSSLNIL